MAQPPYPGYYAGAPMPPYAPNPYAMPPGASPMYPGAPYGANMYMHGYMPPQQYHQPPMMPVPPPMMPYPSSLGQSYPPPPPPAGPSLPSQDQSYLLSGAPKPSPLMARSAPPSVSASHLLKPMTIFLSKIPLDVDDICMRQLLDQCGRVVKWIRMKHPKTRELKNFGFCQFLGPAGLVGTRKLLSGLKINDNGDDSEGLLVRIGQSDEPLCQEYIAEIIENKDEEWNVKETIVKKIVQDRKLRTSENQPKSPHREKSPFCRESSPHQVQSPSYRDSSPNRPSRRDRSPRHDLHSEERRRRSRTPPPPIADFEESEDNKPKKFEWKKAATQKLASKLNPVIDAFANHAEDNHIATLYSRKERQIRPLMKDPEIIWKQVPTNFDDLANYVFNWEMLDRDSFYNVTIKQFLSQKVCEYLGQPEPELVSFILSKIAASKPFKEIAEEINVVFGQHSQPFLLKIWSQMVFEYLSLQ